MVRGISPLRRGLGLLLVLSLGPGVLPLRAQDPSEAFVRRELTIPVRDGVHLFAVVVTPKVPAKPLPIMLVRTPYGVSGHLRPGPIPTEYRELAEDGYIFVFEDVRGRYRSEGTFVMNGHLHDPKGEPDGTDEATDAYDTIEWLVKNIPGNSGKVGVMGISYPGWLAGMAGVHPHPAVKAISPQAPMTDTWLGDDFFHQGAFRQSFGVEYVGGMELKKDGFHRIPQDRYDRYEWYLKFPTLKELGEQNGVWNLPSWIGFREHPAWDGYWQAKAMQRVLTEPVVPFLHVGGFWDQEDILGPEEAYRTLEKKDAKNQNHLVLGPWYHGGWAGSQTTSHGPMKFGSDVGLYFRQKIERPWFAFWLHGIGEGKFSEAYLYEAGGNRWRTFDAWPPREAKPTKIYLREGGALSFDPPQSAGSDSYVSDPAHPVPYIARPVDGTRWRTWLVEDQRFVHQRPDVLSWETGPLDRDVVVAGDVTAHLFASTSGTDADWVVKLIDVYPDAVSEDPKLGGYQLMVAADILRGRYWKSFSKPEPIPAQTVTAFAVDLHQQMYRIKKGHRIMVQVQSTWFPLYDRNPQTYVPNIFEAKALDFGPQTHRVYRSPETPSHIELGVLSE